MRAPAPMPVWRGVPGTMIFAVDPPAVFLASASSAAFFALLGSRVSARLHGRVGQHDSLFSLARHLRLQLRALGELLVRHAAVAPLVEVLLLHGVEDGAKLG